MPVISACATGLRTNVTRAAPSSSGFPQVVDVDAARGQQPRILRPHHPRAQNAHVSLRSCLNHAFKAPPANLHLSRPANHGWPHKGAWSTL